MNICVFGDSITWGSYDPVNGGWVNLLRNHVEKLNQSDSLYNLGICGDTSSGVLKRISYEAVVRWANKIVVAIGINDVWQAVLIDSYITNISEIYQKAKSFTNDVAFVGLTNINDEKTGESSLGEISNNKIENYDKALEVFCEKEGIKYVRIFRSLSKEDFCTDGIHPNTAGHKKLFDKIKMELKY